MQVQNLSFSYPGRHVFSGFSHDFGPGLTWLRGRNGCGKSTLLQLLCGALAPTAGALAVGAVRLATQPLAYRQAVFWCGPGPVVFDHLSPSEYFGFMRSLYPCVDEAALGQHVGGLGLTPFIDKPLCTLSSGTQRKVWLAMALSAGATVTLMDEPLNALDAASCAYFLDALQQCAQHPDRSWIVTSHEDLGTAAKLAQVLELTLLS